MEKYEVKQGETVLLNVSARANPSKMNYAWTKDGVPLPGPDDAYSWQETVAHKVFYRGPALHVYQAQKEDSGDYECEASNSQGATKTTIIVKVLCKYYRCQCAGGVRLENRVERDGQSKVS